MNLQWIDPRDLADATGDYGALGNDPAPSPDEWHTEYLHFCAEQNRTSSDPWSAK